MTDNPLIKKYMPQEDVTSNKEVTNINPLDKYKTEKVSTIPTFPVKDVNPLEKYTSPEKEGLPPTIPSTANTQGRFSSGTNTIIKNYLTHFAGAPESMAVMAKQLADVTHWPGEEDKPISEYSLYKLGLRIRKAADDLFPTNPAYQNEFITTTLTGGIGSALGFMSSLLLGKGIGMSGTAVGLFTGATGLASDEYQKAIQKGASEKEALNTWAINLPIGATNAIPFNRALGRINGATKGWLGKVIGKWGKEMLEKKGAKTIGGIVEGGLEGAIQNAFQHFTSNATAKELYDAERNLWEGVGEGGAAGLIIGMGLNALGAGVRSRIEKIAEAAPGEEVRTKVQNIAEENPDYKTIINEVLEKERNKLPSKEDFIANKIGRGRAGFTKPIITKEYKSTTDTINKAFKIVSARYPASASFIKTIEILPKKEKASTEHPNWRLITTSKGRLIINGDEALRIINNEPSEVPNNFIEELEQGLTPVEKFVTLIAHELTHAAQFKRNTLDSILKKKVPLGKGLIFLEEQGAYNRQFNFISGIKKLTKDYIKMEAEAQQQTNEELLRNWAKTQVNESEWINYLENGGEPPVLLDTNFAQEFREKAVDNSLPPGATEEDIDAIYRKPTRIKTALRSILYPEYIFKRQADKGLKTEAPMRMSVDIIRGQLSLIQHERDLESWYKTFSSGMKKVDRVKVREAMELVYGLKDPDIDIVIRESYKNKLAKMYEETPSLQKVLEGVDKRGGLIELFEHEKKRFQDSLRIQYENELDPELYKMFSEVIDQGKTVEQAVLDNIDIEGIAKQEFIDRQVAKKGGLGVEKAERDWNAREKVRDRKIKSVKKRELGKLERKVKDYTDIANWGLKDFQTRIELGNYRILDENENTVAWAQNVEDAKKKASEIRNKIFKETGKKPHRYAIEPEISRINPTAKRKGVLAGEVDIFDSLPRYIHSMEKRIAMYPIISKFKKLKKTMPEDFTPDVNGILQQQINAVMGSNYEWMERVVDEFSVAKGWKTGKYRKYTGVERKIESLLKFAYRPSAGYINGATGYGMTYVKVGAEFWVKGSKILREGKYIGPDGKVINIENLVHNLEKEGQLGVSTVVLEDGTISTRLKIWHPFKAFQAPERPVRRHGFAANYILQRELYGKSHEEAVWLALQGVRFQQGLYDTAAIPELFRSPSGKLIFQFKSFMVNQMQLWSTLSKPELMRMIEVQLLLAGPRGMVYLLKSIPVLGAMGLLDDLEKKVTAKDTTVGKLSKGVTGLVGVDLSAPATFQFPNKPLDWLGPTIKDAVTLFQDVVIPGAQKVGAYVSGHPENAPNYVEENFINWAKGLAPITYYWDQLLQSVLWWETWDDVKEGDLKQAWNTSVKNWQTPNIWIRDSNGNKAYQIGGVWDRIALLSGAKLSQQSEEQALRQIWNRNMKIRAENRKSVMGSIIRNLTRGKGITDTDSHDLVLYGIDPGSIPDRYEWAEMTPEQRSVLKARILDKAEAIDHFNFDKVRRLEQWRK